MTTPSAITRELARFAVQSSFATLPHKVSHEGVRAFNEKRKPRFEGR